jgi:hypothetical protein
VFSVSKTRLQWYIFPAYPALALLIAALFVAVGQKISEYHEKKKPIFAVSGILLITFFSYVLAGDTYKSLESLFSGLQQIPQQQIPLDKLVSSVLRSGVTLYGPTQDTRANPTRGRFNVEGIYWRSLKTHYQETAVTELQAKAASGEVRDFVAPFATPYVESGIASAQSYLLLPQFKTRREMLIAFSSGNDFTAIEQYVPAHLLKPFFGLGEMRDIGPRNVRFFQKPRAALQVQADELLARYPSRWNLRVGWSGTGKVKTVIVHVQVNERQLATLTLKKKSVTDYHFETPAGVLLPGENVLLLTVRDANGQLVDASAEQIYIEHLVSNLR